MRVRGPPASPRDHVRRARSAPQPKLPRMGALLLGELGVFERRGQPYLGGYSVSSYGVTATRVQLLVDSLDSSGRIVAQRVECSVAPASPSVPCP